MLSATLSDLRKRADMTQETGTANVLISTQTIRNWEASTSRTQSNCGPRPTLEGIRGRNSPFSPESRPNTSRAQPPQSEPRPAQTNATGCAANPGQGRLQHPIALDHYPVPRAQHHQPHQGQFGNTRRPIRQTNPLVSPTRANATHSTRHEQREGWIDLGQTLRRRGNRGLRHRSARSHHRGGPVHR